MTQPHSAMSPGGRFHDPGTGSRPGTADRFLLLATVLFGLSVRPGPWMAVAVVVAAGALATGIALYRRDAAPAAARSSGVDGWILSGVALFGFLGIIGWAPAAIGPTSNMLAILPGTTFIGLAGITAATRRRPTTARFGALALAALVTVGGAGAAHIESAGNLGFDAYHLHVAAADAIANGQNPYTDVVVVPDGSPIAKPGDVITGYTYPPITAIGYALGHWLTPDARYSSLLAWLVVLSLLGVSATRKRSERHLSILLLLASVPGLWLVLRGAWTEPLSIMFFAIALALWARPAPSGLGLGAMLASKQYFLLSGPITLLHRDRGFRPRLLFAGVVLILTIGPALIWDFGAFWDSVVLIHTTRPPRADSSNLVGLFALAGVNWAPPVVVPLVVGLAAGVWAGRGSHTRRSFAMATALSLAASFLVAWEAFANYWFMVFGSCALALLDER